MRKVVFMKLGKVGLLCLWSLLGGFSREKVSGTQTGLDGAAPKSAGKGWLSWRQVELSRKRPCSPRGWLQQEGPLLPRPKKKKSRKIGREQIGFVFFSWMEYFSFTFLLMAVESEFSRLPGLGYSSFPTEKRCFFRTTFLLKQKGYCPGKDFDFVLLKSGNFFLQELSSGFHSTFAPATSLGALGTVPELGLLQGAAPLVPHVSLALSGKQKKKWNNPQTAHPPCPWCMDWMPGTHGVSQSRVG